MSETPVEVYQQIIDAMRRHSDAGAVPAGYAARMIAKAEERIREREREDMQWTSKERCGHGHISSARRC